MGIGMHNAFSVLMVNRRDVRRQRWMVRRDGVHIVRRDLRRGCPGPWARWSGRVAGVYWSRGESSPCTRRRIVAAIRHVAGTATKGPVVQKVGRRLLKDLAPTFQGFAEREANQLTVSASSRSNLKRKPLFGVSEAI
jgi:hypothetical protein